jgi:cellulose synthase/poly-beta-1,6-N-acetylglucosamine synthase-like glycosyltransferase
MPMPILSILLAALTIVYAGAVWLFILGWKRLSGGDSRDRPPVSVVLAARDEAGSIEACLRSLVGQNYSGRFEIIVADDHSADGTDRVVAEVAKKHAIVRLIRITAAPPGWAPKKFALSEAIDAGSGEIILTTDADCIAPPAWIDGMVRHFEPGIDIVAGPVTLDYPGVQKTLWTRLQRLELFSLFAAAVGGNASGIITASGGNLAYHRDVYRRSGGLSAIRGLVSGDDDLLVQRMVSAAGAGMRFSVAPQTTVTTRPHPRLGDFFRQRRRWASKAVHQQPRNLLFLLLTFLLNLFLTASLLAALIAGGGAIVPLGCLAVKAFSELVLLVRAARRMDFHGWLPIFPLWELLHPPYIIIAGLAGLGGDLRWKDRRFRGQKGITAERGS